MKYTYDDVVTAKDILTGRVKKEDIIGKTGWFLDCIPKDMSLNTIMRLVGNPKTLKDVDTNMGNSFVSDELVGEDVYLYFLPEKEESAPILKFKIGDRVRIVKDWDGFCEEYESTIGKTGVIEKVAEENESVEVILDSEHEWWWYKFDAVELIEDKAALSPVEGKDKPAYIPFDLSKPEDRDTLRDKWVISNNTRRELKISAFEELDSGTWIAAMTWLSSSTGEGLLAGYTFLDGSPVGKLKDMPF